MNIDMFNQIFQDALFAAIAAIGFAAISKPPFRAYACCAVVAAVGHSLRFVLMNQVMPVHIVFATFVSAFFIGTLAVFLSPCVRIPAETCLFPALLPMIPGIYAYKAFGALGLCLLSDRQDDFLRYFYLCAHNAMTCICILLCMVIGATIPIFMFKKISFRATR